MKRIITVLIIILAVMMTYGGELLTDKLTVMQEGQIYGSFNIGEYNGEAAFATNGWKLYYPFATNNGSTVTDASGNGRTGTAAGDAYWVSTGKTNGAFNFDGTGDYINPGTNIIVNTASSFSIVIWIYSRMTTGYAALMGLKGSTEFNVGIGNNGGYQGYFGFRNYTAMRTTDSRFEVTNLKSNWHCIVWTYNGGNKSSASSYKLYLDGSELAVTTANTFGSGYNNNSIGCVLQPGPVQCFNGKMDEIVIYDRVISASEVLALYNYFSPLTNSPKLEVDGEVLFHQGVNYLAPKGDISMGIYTNQ